MKATKLGNRPVNADAGVRCPVGSELSMTSKSRRAKQLMLTKARFNIYEVEHYGVEENSLDDLRKAGCKNILVLLRDHDPRLNQGCV